MMNRFYYWLILLLSAALLFSCKKTDLPDKEDEDGISQAQIEQFTKIYDDINTDASAALASDNPIAGLHEVAEKFKNTPGLSKVFVRDNALIVEYDNSVRVYWVAFKDNLLADDFNIPSPRLRSENSSLRAVLPMTYPKFLFIYTHTIDPTRTKMNDLVVRRINQCKEDGYNITAVYGERFDREFIEKGNLKGYDGVFLLTHGCFDEDRGRTFVLTGEKKTSIVAWIEKLFRNPQKLSIVNNKVSVSEDFIDEYYKPNDFSTNSFYYAGYCQGMKDPSRRFADVLVKKGVSRVYGFTESTLNPCTLAFAFTLMDHFNTGASFNEAIKPSEIRTNRYLGIYRQDGYIVGADDVDAPHDIPLRQEIYRDATLQTLDFAADFVSYPTNQDFRFEKVLRLESNEIEIPEGGVGTIKVISDGSGDYAISRHESEEGIIVVAAIKGKTIHVKGQKAGTVHLKIKDNVSGKVGMCKVVVKSQQDRIDEILPPDQVQIIEDLDMPINKGTNPPIINGCYFASPYVLSRTNIADDFPIGYQFADFTVLFYDQDNTTFNIKLKGWHANSLSTSIETSITSGSDNKFTIYGKVRSDEIDNPSVYTIQAVIYSGEYDNGVIRNFKKAFVMLEKNDPEDKYMPVGSARVVEDGDGISPQVPVPAAAMMRHSGQNQGLSMYIRRR